ncbi:MAG TPA: hypothetical protein VNZ06_08470 [Steroidobacteraceae bacterium]|nr:hypothetical protein [Steroidobacteraceae bacterium]
MRGLFTPILYAGVLSAALLQASCSDPPVLRSRADAATATATNSNDPLAAQCQQLRDQIRANQESQREAASFSTNPQIVAAAQAKADQRIERLHERLDELDCADQDKQDSSNVRIAPLPPAPNAPNP